MSYQVLLFYKYVTIQDPKVFASWVESRGNELGFKGRILVAEEGINGTLEGSIEATEQFAKELLERPLLQGMNIKRSVGNGEAFPRWSVKVRNEIVGTQFTQEEADPRVRTAPHLPPAELRAMYERGDDFIVVDMRNSYEIASGKFEKTIDPGLSNSRDLKKAIVKLEPYKNKKIITVCTGGVRCEKMSAFLLNHGFTDVHQLENGMHAYMEKYPGKDFKGTLYTFDDRIVMDFGGDREIIGRCATCNASTERYVNCGNDLCHVHILMCEQCAPADTKAFCGWKCRLSHAYQLWLERVQNVLKPVTRVLERIRYRTIKRWNRLVWKVKRAKMAA